MNKQELIISLESAQNGLEEAINSLSPEQLTATGAVGVWSVKDVLAHVAAWTARCITILFNAEDYETLKDRPLDLVLGDWRSANRQLVKRLGGWKEDDLFDLKRFSWLRGQSLGEFIGSEIADHARDHEKQIRALAA
jgi:uncharacterized damage-inducible protein DinB